MNRNVFIEFSEFFVRLVISLGQCALCVLVLLDALHGCFENKNHPFSELEISKFINPYISLKSIVLQSFFRFPNWFFCLRLLLIINSIGIVIDHFFLKRMSAFPCFHSWKHLLYTCFTFIFPWNSVWSG